MNDKNRADVFRKVASGETPVSPLLKEAVQEVRSDLKASNTGHTGEAGSAKWAVRYPNGKRPANEADTVFMANARSIILNLFEVFEKATEVAIENEKKLHTLLAEKDKSIAEKDEAIGSKNVTIAKLVAERDEIAQKVEALREKAQALGDQIPEPILTFVEEQPVPESAPECVEEQK